MEILQRCSHIGCTTWTLTKHLGKKTRWVLYKDAACYFEQILEAVPHKQQLYGHLNPISQTIQVRWTRHVGHCLRSWDKLTSDVLLWNHLCWLTSKDLHLWELNWFPYKKNLIIFVQKISSRSCNFCVSIFAFIDQFAHLSKF